MKKFSAIIFDMDGTIIDTEQIWNTASIHLLAKRGISIPDKIAKELYKKLNGVSLFESCKIIKEMAQLSEEVHELINENNLLANQLYEKGITFVEGFAEFHKKLAPYSIKSGVATNATPSTVEVTNKILNLEQFFGKHIYNISDVNNIGKPDPAIYLHTAKKLETDPKLCLAIEDSTAGIKAAKAAGMFCIGINTSKDRSRLEYADMIIDGYCEINLLDLLKK